MTYALSQTASHLQSLLPWSPWKSLLLQAAVIAASGVSKRETSRSYFSAACERCLWARVK